MPHSELAKPGSCPLVAVQYRSLPSLASHPASAPLSPGPPRPAYLVFSLSWTKFCFSSSPLYQSVHLFIPSSSPTSGS